MLSSTDGAARARPTVDAAGAEQRSDGRPDHRPARPIALRALGRLVTAALAAGVLLAGFVAYGLLDNRWYHVVAVTGGSMSPTIESGDLIVITRPPAVVEPGMVLTLEVDGAVVTHRVVEVRSDGSFVTQGDANDVRDDFSRNRVRIVGEYRFRLPGLGALMAGVQQLVSGAFLTERGAVEVTGTVGSDGDATTRDVPAAVPLLPAPGADAPGVAGTPEATAAATPEPAVATPPTPDPAASASLPMPAPTPEPSEVVGHTSDPSVAPSDSPLPTNPDPTPDPTPEAPSPVPGAGPAESPASP